MDVVTLSRLQFALTVGFHFIFPSITIGLAGLIAITETMRWRTKRDVYDRLSVFLTKLFAVTFVIGVVTGVVMEFQFGTNWSVFAGLVGDIFGTPLAAEGIFAFFLESAFVGLILFGRHRISSTVRWLASLIVYLGTLTSAFWIIAANSWMHTPAGYAKYVDSSDHMQKIEMKDVWAAIFNPSTLPRFFHTVSACAVVGAFVVMGIGAFYVLRRRHLDVAGVALRMGIIVAFVGSILMFLTGDFQTREVATYQPTKFAAMEGVFKTARGVAMTIISLPPSQTGEADGPAIEIDKGLSLLQTGDANGEIQGLDKTDPSLWPPVAMTWVGFHAMVGIGSLMLLLMIFGAFYLLRRSIETHTTWLRFAVLAIPLPILAVELGWMTTEVGRQPWIVQGLLKTNDAVSPGISQTDVAVSLIGVIVLYVLLFALWLYTLGKEILQGPEPARAVAVPNEAAMTAAAAPTGTPMPNPAVKSATPVRPAAAPASPAGPPAMPAAPPANAPPASPSPPGTNPTGRGPQNQGGH